MLNVSVKHAVSMNGMENKNLTFFVLFCRGDLPVSADLLTKENVVKIKRCLYALQRDGLPPITTHNVVCLQDTKAKL